jgi:hypothetical protein
MWIAAGVVRGVYTHGATGDFGCESVQDVVNVHDVHTTPLLASDLDHRELAVQHFGRGTSLTPDFPDEPLNLAQDLREAPWISRCFSHFLPP